MHGEPVIDVDSISTDSVTSADGRVEFFLNSVDDTTLERIINGDDPDDSISEEEDITPPTNNIALPSNNVIASPNAINNLPTPLTTTNDASTPTTNNNKSLNNRLRTHPSPTTNDVHTPSTINTAKYALYPLSTTLLWIYLQDHLLPFWCIMMYRVVHTIICLCINFGSTLLEIIVSDIRFVPLQHFFV